MGSGRLFKQVVVMAGDKVDPHPLGALTTAHRDLWTTVRSTISCRAAQD